MPFGISQGLTIAKQIPGLGGIASLGESIFGKHSEYDFVPGKPPGAWRGQAAFDDYNARMRALGYTRTLRGGLVVMDTDKPQIAAVMPGGSVLVSSPGRSSKRRRSGGAINRRKRRRSKRRTRGSARRSNVRRRRKARLTKRQLAAGFGGRRRM